MTLATIDAMKKKGKTEKLIIAQKKPFSFPFWDKYFSIKEQCLLFVLVIGGTLLRVVNAIYTPLWRDEIYIFFTARDNSLWKLITQQHWDTAHPPLHSIFLHFWQMISIQPLWLRLPSLIASFFILYLIPILAIKITKKYKTFPFIFLFLFSISHTQISLNMVVRPYPFVSLFSILSIITFINLLQTKQADNKQLNIFVLSNFLAINIDYSTVWLFGCYLIFYCINLFNKTHRLNLYSRTFKALFLSFICACLILPIFIKNINKSINLEKYLTEKFTNSNNGITSGSKFFVIYDRKNKYLYFLNEKMEVVKQVKNEEIFSSEKYTTITSNSSPLSLLLYKNLVVCDFDTNSLRNIKYEYTKCVKKSSFAFENTLKFKSPFVFYGHLLSYDFIINMRRRQWENVLIVKSKSEYTRQFFLFSGEIKSLHLILPPGINIYDKYPEKFNKNWWDGISRLTITTSLKNYVIDYVNQAMRSVQYMSSSDLIEKFQTDFFFFSGVSSHASSTIEHVLVFILIFTSVISLFFHIFARKHIYQPILLMLIIYVFPPMAALVISYYFVPIFLARNLYISSIAYLVGISLLLSGNKLKKYLYLILGFILVLFIFSFPYLHYVDPPYNIDSVFKILGQNLHRKKYVVVEEKIFLPLLLYQRAIGGNKITYTVVTQKAIEDSITVNKVYKNKEEIENFKSNSDLFFLKFGIQKYENGHEFENLSSLLNCKKTQYPIEYMFFAKCK